MVFPTRPVGDATLEQLQERLASTFRVENQAAAVRAETLAELTRREGVHVTENDLREKAYGPVAKPARKWKPQWNLRSCRRRLRVCETGRSRMTMRGFWPGLRNRGR